MRILRVNMYSEWLPGKITEGVWIIKILFQTTTLLSQKLKNFVLIL